MLKKVFWIFIFIFLFFSAENALFHLFSFWFKPNLILLFIIYINLKLGIRYGLMASFMGGLLKDSFSSGVFGSHILAFMACSYVLVLIRRYFFHLEAVWFRLALTTILVTLNIFMLYSTHAFCLDVQLGDFIIYLLLPELCSTALAVFFFFDYMKKCALKLFV